MSLADGIKAKVPALASVPAQHSNMPIDGLPLRQVRNSMNTPVPFVREWFPWLRAIPDRLVQKLVWTQGHQKQDLPSGAIILLYAGKEDAAFLDSVLRAVDPGLTRPVQAFDIRRDGMKELHELLAELQNLEHTKVVPKPNAGPDQDATGNDSVLLLREATGHDGNLPRHSECSRAPVAHTCSSIWVTPAVQEWARSLQLSLIRFDQSEMGQVATKATTIATALPFMHWDGLRTTPCPPRISVDTWKQ